TKQAADLLHLSDTTVATHRANIMRKLNLNSLSDLVRYAIRHQLITP
ncbi:MAG: response regulator transcription factor, partial [Terriglobales bacterium]